MRKGDRPPPQVTDKKRRQKRGPNRRFSCTHCGVSNLHLDALLRHQHNYARTPVNKAQRVSSLAS